MRFAVFIDERYIFGRKKESFYALFCLLIFENQWPFICRYEPVKHFGACNGQSP